MNAQLKPALTFNVEKFADIELELIEVFPEAHEELQQNRQKVWNPDLLRYRLLEDSGILCITTARHQGQLAGYFIFLLMHDIGYSDWFTAYNNLVYLRKPFRGQGRGSAFLAYTLDHLKSLGVRQVYIAQKVHSDHSPWLEKAGFKLQERLFIKLMD